MSDTKIPEAWKFIEEHRVTNLDLEIEKNPDLTREKAGRLAKKKNKRLFSKLKKEIVPNLSLMLTSTIHERLKNSSLTRVNAEKLAIQKNKRLIETLKEELSCFYGKRIVIYEKLANGSKREIFSRIISKNKNEILILAALFEKNTKLGLKELSEIATAYSCRLSQSNHHAVSIIKSTIKAFKKGNATYIDIVSIENKKISLETATSRIHKELRKLVNQKVISEEQRKILVKMLTQILQNTEVSELSNQLMHKVGGEHINNIMYHLKNIKGA